MTSPAPHWESRNGYTPPPRFQQLRARDNQQQQFLQNQVQQQQQQQFQQNQAQYPPGSNSGSTSSQSPEMSHSRSRSFFSFRGNKQSTDGQSSAPLRNMSVANPNMGPAAQQYLPPPSKAFSPAPAPAPPRQPTLPPPQNIPGPSYGVQQQQQQPNYASQAAPPQQQASPPLNQQSQPQPQRPQPQSQQSTGGRASAGSNQQATVARSPSMQAKGQQPEAAPPLHPEIRSVVQLAIAHAHKIYFSGPLVRRFERQPDGQRPHKDDGWTEVWAQLGGTTLSVWDMKEIQEASKQGREVPPSYINVTDAFVQVLGSVTVPATPTTPSKRYTNVLTLNTAGSNLLLFSCPSTAALISWAASLRLAAWEKSRLEEIYTAHLIRITLSARDIPTTLVHGKTEGWARVRIAGQTDWKRVWFVVQEGNDGTDAAPAPAAAAQHNTIKKKRMSNLFSRDSNVYNPLPAKPLVSMFTSPKPKDRKKPLLTMHAITQAFGVYPERPELINKSTLIKIEGTFGDDEIAATLRTREGWLLVMPELENSAGQAAEMLKWIVALHDAFELYGRPEAWTWDPRDPISLMFGYPVGPQKENLFLDREIVETTDPRDDRTSAIRSEMKKLLLQNMRPAVLAVPQQRPVNQQQAYESPPSLPPMALAPQNANNVPPIPQKELPPQASGSGSGPPPSHSPGFQLPPLSFGGPTSSNTTPSRERPLTPITESSSIMTHQRSTSKDAPSMLSPGQSSYQGPNEQDAPSSAGMSSSALQPSGLSPTGLSPTVHYTPEHAVPGPSSATSVLMNGPFSQSPQPASPTSLPPNSSGPTIPTFAAAGPMHNAPQVPNSSEPIVSTFATNNIHNAPQVPESLPNNSTAAPANSNVSSIQGRTSLDTRSPPTSQSSSDTRTPPTSPPSTFAPSRSFSPPPPEKATIVPSQEQAWQNATQQRQPTFLQEVARSKTQDTFSSKSSADASALASMNSSDGHPVPRTKNGWDHGNSNQRPQPAVSSNARSPPTDEPNDFMNEAGALYYMQQANPGAKVSALQQPQRDQYDQKGKMTDLSDELDEDEVSSIDESVSRPNNNTSPPTNGAHLAGNQFDSNSTAGTVGRGPPMTSNNNNPSSSSSYSPATGASAAAITPVGRLSPTRSVLGRKPSGARAQVTAPRSYNGAESISSQTVTEADETRDIMASTTHQRQDSSDLPYDDANGEALAALTYLDIVDSEDLAASSSSMSLGPEKHVEPLKYRAADGTPSISLPTIGDGAPYKSSFAPSNKAAERKAKVQAQQAAQHAATHKPGRANGKRKSRVAGAWESSEEEEEEEEEDDDDDEVDSDSQKPTARGPQSVSSHYSGSAAPNTLRQGLPQLMQTGPGDYHQEMSPTSHPRPARNLPQIPGPRGNEDFHPAQPIPRRMISDQHAERRTYYEDGTPIRTQAEFPQPGAARQSVWSQVLDPGRQPGRAPLPEANARDTFVQLEPSETMTKAFTPQGLLSAGLADKEDRSARRQEEVARENGASLINVPNKPPPPQTGLLGAITAHERERKREGGVGAALTEREREKRLAEERQRRFDDHQRQQLDQMQQGGGSMYGNQFGYNPMMGNPMMMGMNPMMGMAPMMSGNGMNPMMTGGGMNSMMPGGGNMAPLNPMMSGQMNYPGMMGGFNPQHMFAAQQAAAAYQQAMMAFSVAGPQVGGDATGAGASQGNPGLGGMNPAMSGMPNMGAMNPAMGAGGMPGYDPRMSMMGMPMMGMGMGMGMGGGMGQQMGGGQMGGGPMPLGMQMTGMSNFDPRSSPGGVNGGSPANDLGLQPPNQAQFSSRTSSPASRGSPLARGGPETAADRGRSSRPTSP